jgi:hypothetical protein
MIMDLDLVMTVNRNHGSSIDIALGLWAGWLRTWGLILVSGKDFSLLQSIHTSSEAHPTLYPVYTGGPLPLGKAAVHFHLVSGLMYGAMPPLNIFVAWYIIKQTGNFTL